MTPEVRTITLRRCTRCQHEWWPQVELPKRCASCRSPLWNTPKLPTKKALRLKAKGEQALAELLQLCVCLFLFAFTLSAATTIIDCGSASDSNFTGGTVYVFPALPPGTNDTTLRYDAFQTGFTYRIPATEAQIVTLRFIDPSVSVIGGRVFSVFSNNQPVLQGLDIVAEAGPLKPLSRTLVLYPSDGWISLTFRTSVRSAVVSSIEYRPLLDDWWPAISRGWTRPQQGSPLVVVP
jgi:hypothetical protein